MYSHPSFIKLLGGDSPSDSGDKIINCQSSVDIVGSPGIGSGVGTAGAFFLVILGVGPQNKFPGLATTL